MYAAPASLGRLVDLADRAVDCLYVVPNDVWRLIDAYA